MSTVATTNTTADDDSITDLLKETSRDYLKGIGQGVSALLKTDGDGDGDDPAALTEEQRRLEREREKEHQRREDEYIAQQKRRVLEEEEQRRRRTATPGGAAPHQTASPASHQMTFTLTSSLKKEYVGKAYTVYAIEVVWNGVSWTVYRRYKQFNDFSSQAKKASFTFAYALPGKKIQGNLKDHFVEQRQRELQKYVQAVNEKAPAMMSNKKARVALLRFFAPTQVGDKASGGGLPFDLSDLV